MPLGKLRPLATKKRLDRGSQIAAVDGRCRGSIHGQTGRRCINPVMEDRARRKDAGQVGVASRDGERNRVFATSAAIVCHDESRDIGSLPANLSAADDPGAGVEDQPLRQRRIGTRGVHRKLVRSRAARRYKSASRITCALCSAGTSCGRQGKRRLTAQLEGDCGKQQEQCEAKKMIGNRNSFSAIRRRRSFVAAKLHLGNLTFRKPVVDCRR